MLRYRENRVYRLLYREGERERRRERLQVYTRVMCFVPYRVRYHQPLAYS